MSLARQVLVSQQSQIVEPSSGVTQGSGQGAPNYNYTYRRVGRGRNRGCYSGGGAGGGAGAALQSSREGSRDSRDDDSGYGNEMVSYADPHWKNLILSINHPTHPLF